jgi:hypothetical protein
MRRKPSQTPTGRLPSLRLFSTLLPVILSDPDRPILNERNLVSLVDILTTNARPQASFANACWAVVRADKTLGSQ